MLMTEPTPKMIKEWKNIFEQYKTRLRPNKKSAFEVIKYLKQKYPVVEVMEESVKQVVIGNITINQCYGEKIPIGKTLKPQIFYIENMGTGKILYQQQDEVFQNCKIIVGVELETSFLMVEGSSLLYDELMAFQGLDAKDLTNYFLVSQYISCLKRFDLLDSVLING